VTSKWLSNYNKTSSLRLYPSDTNNTEESFKKQAIFHVVYRSSRVKQDPKFSISLRLRQHTRGHLAGRPLERAIGLTSRESGGGTILKPRPKNTACGLVIATKVFLDRGQRFVSCVSEKRPSIRNTRIAGCHDKRSVAVLEAWHEKASQAFSRGNLVDSAAMTAGSFCFLRPVY
jgi:hypothetical protein